MSKTAGIANQFRQLLIICGALVALTLAVYWPDLHHDFVNYDDGEYVIDNSAIQNGLNWSLVKWAFTTGHASNWHPLTWISHAIDCRFFGLKAGGHHLVSLLIHAANVLLLFWVLWEMTGAMWRSAFVAALFAWHPLHVESVAWVSERKDVLSAFFWLLTMLAYQRYAVRGPKFRIWYCATLLFFVLGLLSKPMVVTLPFVLLLLDYWPMRRISDCGLEIADSRQGKKGALDPSSIRKLIVEKVPFFLFAVASSVVTFLVQRKGGAVSSSLTLPARLENALISYVRYIGKTFWPENLSVLYPHPGSWPMIWVIAAGVLLVVVSAGLIVTARTRPYLPVGWFWFLGTLVPVIGVVQVGVQSMADRYTYLPAIGLFLMIAWGLPDLLGSWRGKNWALGAGSVMSLAACLLLTHRQVQYWQDGGTLFRHVVSATKDNYLAYNNLGFYLEDHGKPDEAMTNYLQSISINPNYEDAQNNIGHLLAAKGKYQEAIAHYQIALRIKPSLVEAHNNLGNALGAIGKQDEAIAEYQTALRINPDDEDAHNNLGIARAMQGKMDEAIQLLTEAVRLKPSDAGAQSNLGNAFAAEHKFDDAIRHYQIALQLKPKDAQARNNLGNVLIEEGRLDEAKENYLTALKLNPQNPEANYNLGLLLQRLGKPDEARA
ncbi:MAG TPA: tetratricopeptide repeat protein, partial [Verrucomicrobiae bacterium]|nr:tetratricopeptide repeat protein [Verrucomicrobiae bacterium]